MSPFFLLISVGTILLCFSGCYDNPDPVGIGPLPVNDLASTQIDTLYATQHTSTESFLYTQKLDRVMLGINTTTDQWKYEAWTCLKFFQWPDTLQGVSIDSARIQLKEIYQFGNSSAPLLFNVYNATKSLSGDSLSYDSLTYPSPYYSSSTLNTQVREDTGWVTIFISDTALVRNWFISNNDTLQVNNGLVFSPTNTNLIKGFYSFNTSDATVTPKLVVSYDKNGQKGTYTHSSGISKYVSHATPPASIQIATDSMIYVQNGFSDHGEVWFETFQLPRAISLYRATLEITLDTSTSRISAYDSLNAFLTKTDGTINWGYYYYYGNTWGKPSINSTGKRVYKFEVINFITLWKNGVTIPKIILGGKNEGLSFDLFRLYGSGLNTPQALKPKLIITYYQKR